VEVKKTLVKADFGLAADIATVANTFVEIGRMTLPAGLYLAKGFGFKRGQDEAEGRVYISANVAGPTLVDGVLKLELHDANDDFLSKWFELDNALTSQGAAAVNLRQPFPRTDRKVASKDMKLVLYLKGRAVVTLGHAVTFIQIDCTQVTRG